MKFRNYLGSTLPDVSHPSLLAVAGGESADGFLRVFSNFPELVGPFNFTIVILLSNFMSMGLSSLLTYTLNNSYLDLFRFFTHEITKNQNCQLSASLCQLAKSCAMNSSGHLQFKKIIFFLLMFFLQSIFLLMFFFHKVCQKLIRQIEFLNYRKSFNI